MPFVGTWTVAAMSNNATTGTNSTDNVEQVLVANPAQAGTWQVRITHKGTLVNSQQAYSLLLSGSAEEPDPLQVTPSDNLAATGVAGGPFTPSSRVYTIENIGAEPLDWTAAKTADWVTLSATNGTLAAGSSNTVTVSINSNAESLGPGSYTNTVTFTDVTHSNANYTRTVTLWNALPVVNAGPDQTVYMTNSVAWTPASLVTVAWYDAADTNTITKDGSNRVSQWRDKSGNNRHVSQSTDSKKPLSGTRTMNGLSGLDFFDRAQFLAISSNMVSQPLAAIAVAQFDAAGQDLTVFDGYSTTRCMMRLRNTNKLGVYAGSAYVDGATTSNETVIASAEFNGASSKIRKNGGTAATGNPGTGGLSAGLTIGGIPGGSSSYGMDGLICELVFVSGSLTDTERQKIEGYLAHKWGLATNLPSDHPYKDTAPGIPVAIATLPGAVADPDGGPLTTTWTTESGPAAATFANASATNTTATFTTNGVYTLRLTANDAVGSTYDECVITVADTGATHSVTYTGVTASARHYIRGEAETNTLILGYYETASATVGTGGGTGARDDRNAVFGFTLPVLPEGATLESATFNFEITAARDSTGGQYLPELHAYLLDTADPAGSGTNFFYHGAMDPAANAKLAGATSVTIPSGVTTQLTFSAGQELRSFALSGDALTLLKSYYDGNTPMQSNVYFRFNMSEDPAINSFRRYLVSTAASGSSLQLGYIAPTNSPCILTVTSDYGLPTPAGITTNSANTLIQASVDGSPVSGGTDVRYVATGWVGSGSVGSGSGTNVSFTITNDTTLTWIWRTNYWVNLETIGE
jgi:hypothetical protein